MPRFTHSSLTDVSARILAAAGAPDDVAAKVAGWLVNSNLSGHPSHGVIRVAQYVDQMQSGEYQPEERPTVLRETETSVLIDGRFGFGHIAAEALTLTTAAKAKRAGVAIGGIVNCSHIGRLGEWAELGAAQDVLFFMAAGGPGNMRVAPFGGAEGRLATNPMTFGAPASDGDLMMMDFATSATAEGKLRVARDKGAAVPAGQIIDKEGRPTTDPNDFYNGGMILPVGGHKGYALSLMTEILGTNLIGAFEEGLTVRIGTFAFAIDIDVFGTAAEYQAATHDTLERVRNTRPVEGVAEVLAPGDIERKSRDELIESGVDLPDTTWENMLAAAESAGLQRADVDRIAVRV